MSEAIETKQEGKSPRGPDARAIVAFFITLIVALGLDLGSKWLAFSNESTRLFDSMYVDEVEGRIVLMGTEENERVVMPSVLNLKATTNQGAIFGAGQGNQNLFIIVSIGAIGFVFWMFFKSGPPRIERFLLALLLAGIIGNLYDRIQLGYVRDLFFLFPDLQWPGTWSVPMIDYPSRYADRLVFPYIFNLADVFLVCGVTLLVIRNLFFSPRPTTEESK